MNELEKRVATLEHKLQQLQISVAVVAMVGAAVMSVFTPEERIAFLEEKVKALTLGIAALAIISVGLWISDTRRHGESQDLSMRTSCEALLALATIAQDPSKQAELHSVTRGMTPDGVRRLPQCKGRLP